MNLKLEVVLFIYIVILVLNSLISCVFKGRGTVATGRIEQGCIKVGEEVEILGLHQVCVFAFLLYLMPHKVPCTSLY